MTKQMRSLLAVVVVGAIGLLAWSLVPGPSAPPPTAVAGPAPDAGGVNGTATPPSQPQPPPEPDGGGNGIAPVSAEEAAFRARYGALLEIYRAEKYREAYQGYFALAREWPHGGTLGMVVASLASTAPTPEDVEKLVKAADAAPDDVLAQFVAGVSSHYYAHQSGRSKEEKAKYYEQTLKYLERVSPTYDHEPRTFIYRAVSHFRLGHQKEAEEAIERAILIAGDDPDAFYCRAEIFQRSNVDRSLADLQTYIDTTRAFKARGAVLSEAKERRVIRMRDHLLAVKAGKESNAEIFDPAAGETDPMQDPQDAPKPDAPKPDPTAKP